MAPSDIDHQRGPAILGPCRNCGDNAAMYADSSQERWYKIKVSRGELNCMPYQCVECRKKGSGETPRPDARSSPHGFSDSAVSHAIPDSGSTPPAPALCRRLPRRL